jgi:putative ABC transport system ATP-binding protein
MAVSMLETTVASPDGDRVSTDAMTAGNGRTDKPCIIRLEELSKQYEEGGQKRTVLNALNREFYRGEFVCLLGKSGSGKSTLLNLISGIDAPSQGNVVVFGDDGPVTLNTLSDHARTIFRRNNIGIVFQFFNLIPTLTVQENVLLPLELTGNRRDQRERALALLERVGLADRLDTYPDKLSGGEQQRVAIARALAHDPLLILADEPTGNLDEDTGETVLELLLELTRDAGKTLFMATHDPEVARQADRVLHLEHGRLISDRVWREQHSQPAEPPISQSPSL